MELNFLSLWHQTGAPAADSKAALPAFSPEGAPVSTGRVHAPLVGFASPRSLFFMSVPTLPHGPGLGQASDVVSRAAQMGQPAKRASGQAGLRVRWGQPPPQVIGLLYGAQAEESWSSPEGPRGPRDASC